MKDEWILGVLADLRQFADLNGLRELSSKLEHAEEAAQIAILKRAAEFGLTDAGTARSGLCFVS